MTVVGLRGREGDPVDAAVDALVRGRMVVLVDDADGREGNLVVAGSHATSAAVRFMVEYTCGVLWVPMPGADLDRLELESIPTGPRDPRRPAYAVPVDASTGTTTGVSAADRAHTIRVLADPASRPQDLTRPGHVFPLRAVEGGVLRRAGHTEAVVDLVRLAGLPPVGALSVLMDDDGTVASGARMRGFAAEHGLPVVAIADVIARRRRTERLVEERDARRLATLYGEFDAHVFRSALDGLDHVALVMGEVSGADSSPVLVRVHSECLTGDVFGSARCDCGLQLERALQVVAAEGRGVVLYLRGHEGRGIGLLRKMRAYQLQDTGTDTVDANLELGLPVDARDYGVGAQILAALGVRRMRLLTNNPVKRVGLEAYGLEITETVRIRISPNSHNLAYLRTKRDRLGHDLPTLTDETELRDRSAGPDESETGC